MLFKKDYKRAVDIVRDIKVVSKSHALVVEESFIEFFAGTKGNFDEETFREACRKEEKS